MKNISVFAHFDKDNIIDDYIIYYLRALKAVSQKVIFVSGCDLSTDELQKLEGIADYCLAKKHGEYDFGSYKRGWEIAVENGLLNEAESLTFVNDSCYGPFYPLEPIYCEMAEKACDFWGMTGNRNFLEGKFYPCPAANDRHVQSYFLVFKKQVFESGVFVEFMKSIKKEEDKFKIIEKYEIGLSRLLCEAGFGYETSVPDDIGCCNSNDIFSDEKPPFILMKISLLKIVFFRKFLSNWFCKLSEHSGYPAEVILGHFKRVRSIFDFKFRFVRKQVIRVHLKEHRIFILGRWYELGGKNA